MASDEFRADAVLRQLKDFQRSTVDYAIERLLAPQSRGRFLVADEVGLGKTMVARGVIARLIERLGLPDRPITIVYICSNAAIAAQNLAKLNVAGEESLALSTRLTLLPGQFKHLRSRRYNFVSFTPGTTFDMKGQCGTAPERALICRMLKGAPWAAGAGLENLLQAQVRKRENWQRDVRSAVVGAPEVAAAFRATVEADDVLLARLTAACARFRTYRADVPPADASERNALIGELRRLLAETCLDQLEPDLVILDEFQRFKHLLSGDEEGALLAAALLGKPGVRTLLLSATPYKMLTLDHETEDDHYSDFLSTLQFLYDDADTVNAIREDLGRFRQGLHGITDGPNAELAAVRDRLQHQLLRVMCRTERVGKTARRNAMVCEPVCPAPIEPRDLQQAAFIDRVAQVLKTRDVLEYWKSSPYLLNLMKDYDLRRRLDRIIEGRGDASEDLTEALRDGRTHMLKSRSIRNYEPIEPGNPRMRALFRETLDVELWKLLWMPPSLPYVQPGGAYATVGDVTKSLVFSAWSVVPDAIAAVTSFEAERRMVAGQAADMTYRQLHVKKRGLLQFGPGTDGRPGGMSAFMLSVPFPTLAREIDPLAMALRHGTMAPISRELLMAEATAKCEALLDSLPTGGPGNRPDERWYYAAPAMLEAQSDFGAWCQEQTFLTEDEDNGKGFNEHLAHLLLAVQGGLELGPRPDDLAEVMAQLAVAGLGICAMRALRRIAPLLPWDGLDLLDRSAFIALGLRSLFNQPETRCLLSEGEEKTYWRLVLKHGLDGNLQAVLDEQAHVLVESLGCTDVTMATRVERVTEAITEALHLRPATLKVQTLRVKENTVVSKDVNLRTRFALRFGDLRDDTNQAVARADGIRKAFNSPFRPFVLASTSIGQEGLDFHTWCHSLMHWNLPTNPVDLEQREGRVHRYKGHAVRKNVARRFGLAGLAGWDGTGDPWARLFECAVAERPTGSSDLVPYWVYEVEGGAQIERRVPLTPLSREVGQLASLKRNLALYRLVFGQPRQEELLAYLSKRIDSEHEGLADHWRIGLEPPAVKVASPS